MQVNSREATPDAVRRDIEVLLRRLADAWSQGDAGAYADLFCEDAQYVEAPGRRVHGRAAIARSHARVFGSFFKDTRIASRTPAVIRRVAPTVVLVELSGAVVFSGEDEHRVPPNGLMTMVVERVDEGWRIVSFQNTPTGRLRSLRFVGRYFLSRLRRRLPRRGGRHTPR